MGIITPLICFLSFFLILGIAYETTGSKKEILLSAVLSFSAVIVIITEGLTLLHALNYRSILLSWTIIGVVGIFYLYLNQVKLTVFCKDLKQQVRSAISGLSRYELFLSGAIGIIITLVFIQGIIYPPNNWDAMSYHLARIPNWISHQSVEHYPTQTTRQIYQPPFAEYVMMQFNILSKCDYLSASVQFFFFLFSLITIVTIVKKLGLGRHYQLMALMLGVTIPEVILQASSTQNDIVVSFFIITSCVFAYLAIKTPVFKNYLFLGLAIGLGILTKGTAYLYFAPILLIFGVAVLINLYKTRHFHYLTYSIAVIGICLAINAGHYCRNYRMSHTVLGVDKNESQLYSNQKMSPLLLLSGIIKNAGMHFDIIYGNHLDKAANKVIYKLHEIAGININDPVTNYRNMIYSTDADATSEDSAPNLIHLLLAIASSVIFIFLINKKKPGYIATLLFLTLILQIIFFCYYLKWQPWNTRLEVPVFLLFVPFIVYTLSINSSYKKAISYILAPVLLFTTCMDVLHNNNRPFNEVVLNNRFENYCITNPKWYPEYDGIVKKIHLFNYKNIGLLLADSDWEYPLFADCYSRPINPIHLNVNNITGSIKVNTDHIDCIVSTTTNKAFIDYKGKRFYNQSDGNKEIFLYK